MPKFVIEREVPGAGQMSDAEIKAVSQSSVAALKSLGPEIQWLQSYVTGDKIYCVFPDLRGPSADRSDVSGIIATFPCAKFEHESQNDR